LSSTYIQYGLKTKIPVDAPVAYLIIASDEHSFQWRHCLGL